MTTKLDAILELERRGKLPPKYAAALAEARKRGLIGSSVTKPASAMRDTQTIRPDPSVTDYIKAFGAEANRMIARFLGAPGALVHAGTSRLGFPIGLSSEESEDLARRSGIMPIDAPRTDTFGLRLAARAGGMAPFIPLGGFGAWPLAMNVVGTAGAAGAGQLAEDYGAGPLGQLGAEVVGGLAGAGAIGMLPAAMLGAQWAARRSFVAPAVQFAFGMKPSRATVEMAKERVGRTLRAEMTPEATANLEEARAVQETVPGARFSFGEATGLPSVLRTEEQLAGQASGKELNELADMQRRTTAAIAQAYGDRAPSGEVSRLSEIAAERLRNVTGEIERARTRAGMRMPSVPTADRPTLGARVRARAETVKDALQRQYAEMRAAVGNDPLPYGELRDDAKAIIKQIAQAIRPRSTPSTVAGLARRPKPKKRKGEAPAADEIMARELLDVARDLNRQIRKYESSASKDVAYGQALYEAKRKVDDLIDTLPPEQAEAYAAAQRFYRTRVAPIFSQSGPTFSILKRKMGGYAMPEETVVGAYFQRNGSEAGARKSARQFRLATAGDAQAAADLRAYVLDDVARAAVRDGLVDAGLLARWRRAHSEALSELPDLDRELSAMQSVVDAIAARNAQLRLRQKAVNRGVLAGLVKKPMDDAIREALKSPSAMMALRATVRKSPEAQAALARGVWDALGPQVFDDTDALIALLEKKGWMLPLSAEHKHDLLMLAKAARIASRSVRITGRAKPLEGALAGKMREVTGLSPTAMINTIWTGFGIRLTSTRAAVLRIAGSALNAQTAKETQELWRQALLDPAVASELMEFVRAPTAARARKLHTYLFASGTNYIAGLYEQEPSGGAYNPPSGAVVLPMNQAPLVSPMEQ
jgi:hypothetical protein